jgi:hypothetical protein
MADENRLELEVVLDTSKAEQQIQKLNQLVTKGQSSNSSSSGNPALEKQIAATEKAAQVAEKATQAQQKAHEKFVSQQIKDADKVAQAQQKAAQKSAKDAEAAQKAITDAVEKDGQARAKALKDADKALDQWLAKLRSQGKTDTQKNIEQSLKPDKSGGLDGARNGLSQIGQSAGIPGADLLAGGPAAAAVGLVAATASKFSEALNKAADAAKEASHSFSDGGGRLDQLRKSSEALAYQEDKLSDSPLATTFANLQNQIESEFVKALQSASDALVGVGNWWSDFVTGGASKTKRDQQQKYEDDNKYKNLVGDAKADTDKMKRDAVEADADASREREAFARDEFQTKRDLIQDNADFERETNRKTQDLAIQKTRELEDYNRQAQLIADDQAGKMAEKKFQNDRQIASRNHQDKLSDLDYEFKTSKRYADEDFQVKKRYADQDYQLKKRYAQEDKNKSRGDELVDLRDQLVDMNISGASGMDYLRLSRDTSKKFSREDRDFGITQSRDQAEFNLGQGRDQAAFNVSQARGKDKYGRDVSLENRGFGNAEKDAAAQRALEVEQHLYDIKQQSIELEIKHTRNLQDEVLAETRLKEDTAVGKTKLKNREEDTNVSLNRRSDEMNISQTRGKRGRQEESDDYYYQMSQKDPYRFEKFAKNNPEAAKAANRGRRKRGLDGNYNESGLDDSYGSGGSNWGSFAAGGVIDGTGGQPAIVHPGEFIINPNATDKNRQLDLWVRLGKKLGTMPGFADGGTVGGGSDWANAGGGSDWDKKIEEIVSQIGAPGGDYAARFADFANSLTHKSNAEENQKSLSSFSAGSQPLFPTNYWRPQTGGPMNTNPNSYFGSLLNAQPVNMGGNTPSQNINVTVGGGNNYTAGFPDGLKQRLDQMEAQHQADIKKTLQESLNGFYQNQQRMTQGGRQ